ncbi:MAG TPA: VOC family protein [Bacteroidia bacterium]|jgi:catechol 2,3-dioxygenase-like lactoylglutathione lyase family enzyme|nr:VOC family protein [Bacteroidia bacterium]
MSYTLAGIQQIGIGVPKVKEAFDWYRKNFGMDIPIFEEAAEANLMLPYTGGKPHQRHAILAINMKGGGGFEIWQYTSRVPQPAVFEIKAGDLGLFCTRMKSSDVKASFEFLKSQKVNMVSGLVKDPSGKDTFFLRDPWNNLFQIVTGQDWFGKGMQLTGGPEGSMIGVSDMERSILFYAEILGYDKIIYDKESVFADLATIPGGTDKMRRVLLQHSKPRSGAFSKLLGSSSIELIQTSRPQPHKIFENRFWGDQGFIHLCFDINGMSNLREVCKAKGYPFTVDSSESFDMGEAAGHFSYIEDPDGALIEFVETHKIPILKKLGWYLDLRKRDAAKALPDWMLKALSLNRVK